MKYQYRIRCVCGAEAESGDEFGVSAERFVNTWKMEHMKDCAKAIANRPKPQLNPQEMPI